MFHLVRDLIAAINKLAMSVRDNTESAIQFGKIFELKEAVDRIEGNLLHRIQALEQCRKSPNEITPPLIVRLEKSESDLATIWEGFRESETWATKMESEFGRQAGRIGKLEVDAMKRSAKRPKR